MSIRSCLQSSPFWLVCSFALISPALMATDASPTTKPIASKSVATNRISDQPDYAHPFSEDVPWLTFGLQSRSRYESRWHDYSTSNLLSDDAFVTRNLLYLSIQHLIDPLRFAVELEDSRRFLCDRPNNPNIENSLETLQAYAQFYQENAFADQDLHLNLGRMTFDWADRRLISRNRNRNTINAFDGLRIQLGNSSSPWEIDTIAVRPVDRFDHELDETNHHSSILGLAAYWRSLAPILVLEPYWLWLNQEPSATSSTQRDLHTLGVHAFGQVPDHPEWDFDLSLASQWGESQSFDHQAWAYHAELGYSWKFPAKPRLALWLNVASGDQNPDDHQNQRFDPLFGASYSFYGYTNYFSWQNTINPAISLSIEPISHVKCEFIHRCYWLASDTDAWLRKSRQDPTGQSGNFIGQESDFRVIWAVRPFVDIDLSYAHFWPADFVSQTGPSPQADFVQIATTFKF